MNKRDDGLDDGDATLKAAMEAAHFDRHPAGDEDEFDNNLCRYEDAVRRWQASRKPLTPQALRARAEGTSERAE